MAGPTISEVRVSPEPVPVGEQATITVVAFDQDGRQIMVEATVMDASGQTAGKSVAFMVSDELGYDVSTESGVVTQDPNEPRMFIWSPESTGGSP